MPTGRSPLTLALLVVFAALFIKNIALGELHGKDLVALSSTSNLLVAVMMTPWALYTVRQRSGWVDRMFGDLTYIFYLMHWPIIGLNQTGEGSYWNRLWLCSESLLVIMAVSFVIWRVFDHPLNKWRAAWVKSRIAVVGRSRGSAPEAKRRALGERAEIGFTTRRVMRHKPGGHAP